MICKDNLRIRPMNHGDLGLMATWLSDPRVLAFYGDNAWSLEAVTAKYGPRIDGSHNVVPCIVEYNLTPVAYIQYYRLQEGELHDFGYPADESIFGIDQFMGEPDLWGHGIGTTFVSAMLEYLNTHLHAAKVALEVKRTNPRAIRCYEKCGFKRVKNLAEDMILMEWVNNAST
ncbi:GNAT family N-acetyltransferase [Paenibacillus sp. NFR01]|uniref:GNAT family N-acetyltransferase n=1 Tax=Paenibacillus sp. NFR01 TaxID=1566279 RepID=UPI0008CCE7F7|nr:GNAT family N-acetyltransferase [Paenibacillus sp. NFR01]SES93022.1 aminoglycoside 6'-N-acetyltransferase [Paenibacillus sp. NFR01]